MKILKKEWFIWKFEKRGDSREKGGGGNEIHAPSACAVDTWNNLLDSVVTAKNIVTFESRLDTLWKDQPLYYNYKECIQNYPTGHDHDLSRDSSFEMTVEDPVES
jgi:hypothetical protein